MSAHLQGLHQVRNGPVRLVDLIKQDRIEGGQLSSLIFDFGMTVHALSPLILTVNAAR